MNLIQPKQELNRFDNAVDSLINEFQIGLSDFKNKKIDSSEEKLSNAFLSMDKLLDHDKLKGNSLSRKKYKDIFIECYNVIERKKKDILLAKKDKSFYETKDYFSEENKKLNFYCIISDIKELNKRSDEYFSAPIKLLSYIGNSIETGYFISVNLNIRKEIWSQGSAKLNYINQKFEAFNIIYTKIDNISTLAVKGVINSSNFDRFCDILVDIQNSFSKEINTIPQNKSVITYKEVQQNTFHKKFSDFSAKIQTNLFTLKIGDKPNYVETILKLIKKLEELKLIYSELNKSYGNIEQLNAKKQTIANFLYRFLFKLITIDLQELTLRFLKKKIISFEEK